MSKKLILLTGILRKIWLARRPPGSLLQVENPCSRGNLKHKHAEVNYSDIDYSNLVVAVGVERQNPVMITLAGCFSMHT